MFILTEIAEVRCEAMLESIAASADYKGNEIRQAAVWGLGKAGTRSYEKIARFIDDEDDDVALHAIVGFGPDTPTPVIDGMVQLLITGSTRQKAAASEVLRLIGTDYILQQLIASAQQNSDNQSWIISTLGRLPAEKVLSALQGKDLLDQVRPVMNISGDENWLASGSKTSDLRFLLGQNIF